MKKEHKDILYQKLNELKDPKVWSKALYAIFLDPRMWGRRILLWGIMAWIPLSMISVFFMPFGMEVIDRQIISVHEGSDVVTILNPTQTQIEHNMTKSYLSKPSTFDYVGSQGAEPLFFGISLDDIMWNWIMISPFTYIVIGIYVLVFTKFDTSKIMEVYNQLFKKPKVEPTG